MKKISAFSLLILLAATCMAQELQQISLPSPIKTGGLPIMQAFSERASVRDWSDKPLSLQDLSDLLWAANGINRPDGKRTAPSAMNSQDIDVYVFQKEGIYLYDPAKNILEPVAEGDYSDLPGKTAAPVNLVLVSDISRFRSGSDSVRLRWAGMDAGYVSQNILLFCAGKGFESRPRGSFPDLAVIRGVMKLKDTQYIMLNHPVGFGKE
jgi:nitroreductase